MGALDLQKSRLPSDVSICRCSHQGLWLVVSMSGHGDSSAVHAKSPSRAVALLIANAVAALPGYRRDEGDDEPQASRRPSSPGIAGPIHLVAKWALEHGGRKLTATDFEFLNRVASYLYRGPTRDEKYELIRLVNKVEGR